MPADLERRARKAAEGSGRLARLANALAPAPAVAREAVGLALRLVREDKCALPAAVAWWAFDVAVLWSTFEMFGAAPAAGVLALCYFLGQLARVIGAFAACGVPVALAVLAVLAYQAVSRWVPVVPGLWGYLRLRKTVATWSGEAR